MWEQLIERHGWNEEDVVKLKARGIKSLIDQAYDLGWESGKEVGKALSATAPWANEKGDIFLDELSKRMGRNYK